MLMLAATAGCGRVKHAWRHVPDQVTCMSVRTRGVHSIGFCSDRLLCVVCPSRLFEVHSSDSANNRASPTIAQTCHHTKKGDRGPEKSKSTGLGVEALS